MQEQRNNKRTLFAMLLGGVSIGVLVLSACAVLLAVGAPAKANEARLTRQDAQQLKDYQQWITVLKQSGTDVTEQQKQYNKDSYDLQNAPGDAAYKDAQKRLLAHVEAIQVPAMKAEVDQLRQQFRQKVANWQEQHTYTDSYDGVTYKLAYEYGADGADGLVDDDLANAQTVADYQHAIDDLKNFMTNFDAMVANISDKTSYDNVHQTDQQLMNHYKVTGQKVVVVSLQEQALRVYEDGKLVRADLITTGHPGAPSLPGQWTVADKLYQTTFKSWAQPGSPDYYEPTHINYAMQYHDNGYFLHDSWWRTQYGPGTNFPHADAGANNTGSHGCVNIPLNEAEWLYNFVEVGASVIIY